MIGVAYTWGSTAEERERPYPCDDFVGGPALACWRAVDIDAPVSLVFRWLCQIRAAPYSYDWIDNLGRRSPQHLTPDLDDLGVGQRFMTVFRLVAFESDRHVTLLMRSRVVGDVAVTYAVAPLHAEPHRDATRLVAKLRWRVPAALRPVAAAGDLVMMRRQLLNLKGLAERDARLLVSD